MGRLDGKVAIITGAARGQGEAEARLFASEGARVVVADVLADEAEAVAASIGDAARSAALDVTDEAAWQRVVADTEAAWGPVTTLVNNAGILDFNALEAYDAERFRRVLDINVVGAFLGIKSVVPSMAQTGNGAIVNISSNAGMEGLPFVAAYSASKWAIRGLSRSAAIELGRKRIRVNTVHPGMVDTPMTRMGGEVAESDSAFVRNLPIRRVGTVDDIAPVVLFLCSDEAGYVTGAEYVVDGGHLAGDATVLQQ